MSRLLITGANGYIGRHLAAMAQTMGHQVLVLGRRPVTGAAFQSWSLGDAVPDAVLARQDAVIHLAHDWEADAARGGDVNVAAAGALARAALAAGVSRFVFASSVSARATARNAYGRAKFAAENRLAALPGAPGRVVSARIGLVYGAPAAGQYALMRRLTARTAVLPMIGLDRQVQPIHLDETCGALLALALDNRHAKPSYVVAGTPLRFARWLRLLRRAQTGGGLLLVPLPARLMLLAAPPHLRERILGLAGTAPMPDDLKELGIYTRDPALLLRQEEPARTGEVRALLRYLGTAPTPQMARDLSNGLAQAGLSPLHLPRLLVRFPFLMALAEPPASRQHNRLAAALYLAAQVREAYGASGPRRGWLRLVVLLLADLFAMPLRLAMARRWR